MPVSCIPRPKEDPVVMTSVSIPSEYLRDVRVAVDVLKELGCGEVYLFGSLVEERTHPSSDIDIAVRGCPTDKFYYAVGKLVLELEHSVDLIDLDRTTRFTQALETSGSLVRVA